MNIYPTSDMDTFFSDFAIDVSATTWGSTVTAIFDRDYVEFEDVSGEMPFLLIQTSVVPATATTGDLFSVGADNYKLVDVQYAEPGLSRVILASV